MCVRLKLTRSFTERRKLVTRVRNVLEKYEHYFELENSMPEYPRNPPKSIYEGILGSRLCFFGTGVFVALVLSMTENVWGILYIVPVLVMLFALTGIWDDFVYAKQQWHRKNRDKAKFSDANIELINRLVELNTYKGRRDDSPTFYEFKGSFNSGLTEFMTINVWEQYIQKQNPTKREKAKGFGSAHTGATLYITDNEVWSFDPEFISPNVYKVTVERIIMTDSETVSS